MSVSPPLDSVTKEIWKVLPDIIDTVLQNIDEVFLR